MKHFLHIKKRGVTFLELMVVLTILSALILIAAPRLKGFHQGSQLSTSAREIASICRYARAQAILTEQKCEVRFDIDNDQFWLKLQSEDEIEKTKKKSSKNDELQNPLEEVKTLERGVVFKEIASDAMDFKVKNSLVRVIYYPNGSASSAYIVLENEREKILTIEIPTATGYPEVYDGVPTDINDRINDMKNASYDEE